MQEVVMIIDRSSCMTLKRLTLLQSRGLSLEFSLFGCNVARAFSRRATLILFLSIFGHRIPSFVPRERVASYSL